jgi:hypothetical protein
VAQWRIALWASALRCFLTSHQEISVDKALIQAGRDTCRAFAIAYGQAHQVSGSKRCEWADYLMDFFLNLITLDDGS